MSEVKPVTTTATYHCMLCNTDMPNSESMQHLIDRHGYSRDNVLKFKQTMSSHLDFRNSFVTNYTIINHEGYTVGSRQVEEAR